jgi:Flp pilus assembly protein TadG
MLAQRRSKPKRGGALTLEFAVLLPMLALLFLGTVDFCRVFYDAQILHECAQNAALFASGNAKPRAGQSADAMARATAVSLGAALRPALRDEEINIVYDADSATVTITHSFPLITRYPALPQTVVLQRSVTMRAAPRDFGG